ncbi:MAG: hypothetical protein RLZZ517_440 [Candidatus Parcubacteria bacterium]|jgi:hypothetical protein
MDEQKELQTNSQVPQIPINSTSSEIPVDTSLSVEMEQQEQRVRPMGVEIETPKEVIPNIEIPTLRTYKSDVNQTVNQDKISTAKILIAEQNRQRVTQDKNFDTSIKRPTNILVLLLSIVLIVVAIGGIGYFGYKKIVQPIAVPAVAPASFLFVFDQQKFIDSTKDLQDVRSGVTSYSSELLNSKDGTFVDVIFYKTNTQTKEKTRITAQEVFSLYGITLPTNIARSIGKDFVYGFYKVDGKVEPFLVVGVTEYETFYSSMFNWESTLALDIKDLFPNLYNLFDLTKNTNTTSTQIVSTTTSATSTKLATSTQEALTPEQIRQQQTEARSVINRNIRFLDTIFSNNDARAVRDSNGNPFFYYAFLDKTKVLFAQDPKVLSQIKQKIKEKSLVR